MIQDKYQIKLENFQGPLDLLLHLIEKNEINIYDIPVAQVADQYIAYINNAEDLDLDAASEFLVMAATLLAIKAKMLLPKPVKTMEKEEEVDPREELISRLIEYKQYKEVASVLRDREKEMLKIYLRENDLSKIQKKFGPSNPVENISITNLVAAFKTVLQKAQEIEPVYEITREEISIQECMLNILEILSQNNNSIVFSHLFHKGISRIKIIVNFLALLELIKANKIGVIQNDPFESIIIFKKDNSPK